MQSTLLNDICISLKTNKLTLRGGMTKPSNKHLPKGEMNALKDHLFSSSIVL